MKQILKKVSAVITALGCAAAITVAGAGLVWADSEIDETLKEQIVMTAESLTETIIPLSDEDIANYQSSGDDFTAQAMSAWTGAKAELGTKEEQQSSETTVSADHDTYTVTVPVAFDKADANFIYIFDETAVPTSMSVDIQYPMSVTLERAGLNTVMGLGTVFIMLIFLSFVIYLFKFIPKLINGRKKEEPAVEAPAQIPAAVPVSPVSDDTELIAVISAAIAAAEGTSTDGFVVRSIRKVNYKKR